MSSAFYTASNLNDFIVLIFDFSIFTSQVVVRKLLLHHIV